MKKHFGIIAALTFIGCTTTNKDMVIPPKAKKIKKVLEIHYDKRYDNYFWMRLSDEQKNAEKPDAQTQDVLDYLNAENAYTNARNVW